VVVVVVIDASDFVVRINGTMMALDSFHGSTRCRRRRRGDVVVVCGDGSSSGSSGSGRTSNHKDDL
jgi:hypothetical protein